MISIQADTMQLQPCEGRCLRDANAGQDIGIMHDDRQTDR